MSKVIVTRHQALITFLKEEGIIENNVEVISHATEQNVAGKDVLGVLPMRLAALTSSFTEVSMIIPPEYRGRELTVEDIRNFHPVLTRYKVTKLD